MPLLPDLYIERPALSDETKRAFKALSLGNANGHQQLLVAEAMVHAICRVDEDCFAVDPCTTAFNLGRRWAGLVVREIFVIPAKDL